MADRAEERFRWRAVRYRIAVGWVVTIALAWRFIIHPVTNAVLVSSGQEPLPPVDGWTIADAIALLGMPLAGAGADKVMHDA